AGNYQTTEDFLIGSYPLEPIQGGQTFTFTKGDGVSGNIYQNIKYIIENPAGVDFESPLGTDALPVASRVKIVESVQLGIDTLFNVGNQSINGNLVVSGNESGYITGNCLTIGPPTYDHPYTIHTKDGHVGIGTSTTLQAGSKLSVYGRAVGLGDGGRLTGPSDLPYLLSGDAAGGGSQNLQEVTTEGNTTNQGIEVTAGGIKVNDYITHYGDTDTYAGFPSNDNFTVFTAGSNALDIDSSQQVHFPRRVGIGSAPDTTQQLLVVGNSTEIELATTDNYAIRTAQKVDISIGGTISSSGSMIAGGSGNHISGDFDTIAGGTLNNISGGNFNFIGGGSQIDLTGSQYSSSIGGKNNDIFYSDYAIIGGGRNNKIESATVAFIGGGSSNEIHDGVSAIAGGVSNLISGGNGYSFVGGGEENMVYGTFSSILGGEGNKVYGNDAVTLGGWFSESTGKFALVLPGRASKVSGDYAVGLGNKVEIPVAH
ncbi:MAG TPA: hypothetical protein DCM40_43895, partial [Maribacter sp.]|nr:hypothetical protein [Maribacter sp.]